MARKKAAFIAISSLGTLNNASLPNRSFIPLKSFILINNLNTWAAEERLDVHSSGGDYVQNGYYKESSHQPSGGDVYGARNPQMVNGQRPDLGQYQYGGVGHSSYGSGSSWQNSYDSVQQNLGLGSTSIPYSMPQQMYGDYQSANYVQNSHELVNVMMPEEKSSDSPQGTLENLDTCCKEGKIKEAMEVLGLLDKQGISVGLPLYLDLMKICRDEDALEEAKSIHERVVRLFSPLRVSTSNKILQMYARCGSMDDANTVFGKMLERNLTSWDTMINGYAENGLGEEAIDTFTRFKKTGLKPDGEMFISVFNSCAVIGDAIEGMLHFESMRKAYHIVPTMKHYVSVVKMLGVCGYLEEALEFIEKMPVEPSLAIWETLMELSRVHGNSELGNRCAEIVERLDASYLTNEMKAGLVVDKGGDFPKKKSTQTSLDLRTKAHEYRAGDKSHPEHEKLYTLLRGMKEQLKEAGYVPDCRFVLHDIDQEGKEEALMAHSERLATAHALITTSARSPIRIIKNLRICVDCHNAFKIVSTLVGRELIHRDAKRFHHMKDGKCSCNDYW